METTTLPEMALAILIGVASGVIAALVIWALAQVVRKNVIPWYRAMIYKGFDVSGTWIQEPDGIRHQQGTFVLAQQAEQLAGTSTHVIDDKSTTSARETRSFNVEGEVIGHFVRMHLTHTDPQRLGLAQMLLRISGDGRVMEGQLTIYAIHSNKIRSFECRLRRPELMLPVEDRQAQLPLEQPRPEEEDSPWEEDDE